MDKKAFMNTLSSQITEWQKELADLSARGEQAGEKAKTEIQSQIKELNSRLDDAQGKLKRIQAVGPDAWEDVREGLRRAGQRCAGRSERIRAVQALKNGQHKRAGPGSGTEPWSNHQCMPMHQR